MVLTRDASFVRKEEKLLRLMERVYRDYPKFLERVRHRHVDYNCTYRWAREPATRPDLRIHHYKRARLRRPRRASA